LNRQTEHVLQRLHGRYDKAFGPPARGRPREGVRNTGGGPERRAHTGAGLDGTLSPWPRPVVVEPRAHAARRAEN
jgi:hypothetical protein